MTEVSDIVNICNIELATLSPIQWEYHLSPEAIKLLDNDKKYYNEWDLNPENPESSFSLAMKKSGWGVNSIEKVEIHHRGDGIAEYIINNKMDFLIHSYLIREFPRIEVDPRFDAKVQISWCDNIGHHSYEYIQLWVDKEKVLTITPVWLDIRQRYLLPSHMKEKYMRMVGDERFTGHWGKETMAFKTKTPLPFHYSRHITQALPLFVMSSKSEVKIVIKYKTRISELVRMRIYDDENKIWVSTPFNWKLIKGVGPDKIGSDLNNEFDKLKIPEMFSKYCKISKEEKIWFEEDKMIKRLNDGSTINIPLKYYMEDIIILPVKSNEQNSPSISVNLSSKLPVKAIFWVMQNKNGIIYNNYSNYTTNKDGTGDHPVDSISIEYNSNEKKIHDMEPYHFDEIASYYDGISSGDKIGYGFYNLCHDVRSFNQAPIALLFNNAKAAISFKLKSNVVIKSERDKEHGEDVIGELLKNKDKSVENTNIQYNAYVILLVTKRIDIFWGDKILNGPKILIHDGNTT